MTPKRFLLICTLPLLAALAFVGCDNGGSSQTGETREYMENTPLTLDDAGKPINTEEAGTLILAPGSVTASAVGDTIVFTASGGNPPYSWNVGNAAYGEIDVRGGNPCVYIVKTGNRNSIYVKDSRGNVAVATITVSP